MSLFITSLNSGSNGNCYYVGNGQDAVLIDAGLSCRETVKRMNNLQLSMDQVRALFISHEHRDHITGAAKLSKQYSIPVYVMPDTLQNAEMRIEPELVHTMRVNEKTVVGSMTVMPFAKHHDAADPVSFLVEHDGVKAGVFTDIGKVCKTVIHYFRQCHACFLESNYDRQMLEEGTYPWHLKKRISGGQGHLSNTEALELFLTQKPSFMSHLLLSHLSENNNSPAIVEELFTKHSGTVKIIVAPRTGETAVYKVVRSGDECCEIIPMYARKQAVQLTMF
ncbi:MAG: MBL fold metallo-hydrolase [Chitinophagales bacterium]